MIDFYATLERGRRRIRAHVQAVVDAGDVLLCSIENQAGTELDLRPQEELELKELALVRALDPSLSPA